MSYKTVTLSMNVVNTDNGRFSKELAEAAETYKYAVYLAAFKVGQEIRDAAKALAPVDTGALQKSIYVTRPPTSKQMGGIGGDVGSTLNSKQSTRGYLSASKAAARAGGKKRKLDISELESDNPNSKRNLKRRSTKRATRSTIVGTDSQGITSTGKFPVSNLDTSFSRIGEFLPDSYYVSVGASVNYAIYLEFGTHRMKAQPFLRPAFKGVTDSDIAYQAQKIAEKAEKVLQAKIDAKAKL